MNSVVNVIYAWELWKPCHGSIYRRTWNVPIEKISGQQFQATVNIYHWKSSLKIDKSKLQCNIKKYVGEEINHLSKNCKTLLLKNTNTKYIVEKIRQLSKNRKSQVHCQLVLSESPAVRLTIGLCHKLNWCTFYCVPTYHQREQGRNTWTKTKHTQQT